MHMYCVLLAVVVLLFTFVFTFVYFSFTGRTCATDGEGALNTRGGALSIIDML